MAYFTLQFIGPRTAVRNAVDSFVADYPSDDAFYAEVKDIVLAMVDNNYYDVIKINADGEAYEDSPNHFINKRLSVKVEQTYGIVS